MRFGGRVFLQKDCHAGVRWDHQGPGVDGRDFRWWLLPFCTRRAPGYVCTRLARDSGIDPLAATFPFTMNGFCESSQVAAPPSACLFR